MKQLLTLFVFLGVHQAAFSQNIIEGSSKYIVETRDIVIEGQSALDLFLAMKASPQYRGNKTATKKGGNVTCTVGLLPGPGNTDFSRDAICWTKLSARIVDSE